MKKNAMLKIAAILMVAVLLTTCAISSTFAKYVTTASGSASARVAKWGVTASVTTKDAFANSYTHKDKGEVVASGEFVIAPGTKSENAIVIEFAGKPEVETEIALTAKNGNGQYFTLSNWGDGYCPLVFTVKVDTAAAKTITGANAAAIMKNLNDELATAFKTTTFDPNKDVAKKVVIGWSWAYEVDKDTDTDKDGISDKDEIDTAFGNLCTNVDDNGVLITEDDPSVSFDFSAVIFQVGADYATKTTEAPSTGA